MYILIFRWYYSRTNITEPIRFTWVQTNGLLGFSAVLFTSVKIMREVPYHYHETWFRKWYRGKSDRDNQVIVIEHTWINLEEESKILSLSPRHVFRHLSMAWVPSWVFWVPWCYEPPPFLSRHLLLDIDVRHRTTSTGHWTLMLGACSTQPPVQQPNLRFLFTHEVFTHIFLSTRFFRVRRILNLQFGGRVT